MLLRAGLKDKVMKSNVREKKNNYFSVSHFLYKVFFYLMVKKAHQTQTEVEHNRDILFKDNSESTHQISFRRGLKPDQSTGGSSLNKTWGVLDYLKHLLSILIGLSDKHWLGNIKDST